MSLHWLQRAVHLAIPLAIATALLQRSGNLAVQNRLATALLLLIMVVGLHIFSGNSGVISFGHASFVMLAAYTSALLTIPVEGKAALFSDMPAALDWLLRTELPVPVGVVAAALLASIVAFLAGLALMRLSGLEAGIASLSLLVIMQVIIAESEGITRGKSTMVGVPRWTTTWWSIAGAVGAITLASLYQESKSGLRLRASREDSAGAESVGINITKERLKAWTLSGAITGFGGALYGHYIATFSTRTFDFGLTFSIVAMLVIGGMGSLTGALYGVAFVQVSSEVMRNIETNGLGPIPQIEVPGLTQVVLSGILLLVLILRPSGLSGGREIRVLGIPRLRKRLSTDLQGEVIK